jgi:hypothetical protein
MSALHPIADIHRRLFDVSFVPIADIRTLIRLLAALAEAALQRKVTRLKEKSGFSSSLPPVWQLYRANFPPTQTPLPPAFFVGNRSSKRRDRMTDWVIRKFATDIDEPVLAEPRKGFFVRFMEALRETRRRQARREIAKHAHLLSNDSWR